MPPRRQLEVQRLGEAELAEFLAEWPFELRELARELRRIVLAVAPSLDEGIAFHSLSYTVPGRAFGAIGGNVALIGRRGDAVHLAFLHGAGLPDPQQLLAGSGKAKRHVALRSRRELPREALEALIRAAVAHDPSA